jgi:hypothetical protein
MKFKCTKESVIIKLLCGSGLATLTNKTVKIPRDKKPSCYQWIHEDVTTLGECPCLLTTVDENITHKLIDTRRCWCVRKDNTKKRFVTTTGRDLHSMATFVKAQATVSGNSRRPKAILTNTPCQNK